MSTGKARDMSAKLRGKLAEVLERELLICQHVLAPTEIGEIMIEAAVMTARTTAATIAAYASDRGDIEHLFRSITVAIVTSLVQGEQDGITRAIAAVEARSR